MCYKGGTQRALSESRPQEPTPSSNEPLKEDIMKTQQKMKFKQKRIAALVSLALAMGAGTADAALQRMGPINNAPTVGGFPSWFQDTTGLTMEFCDLINQAELNGGWCTLIPPTPATAPETFPTNF